jgi:hypothetical protein
MPRVLMPDIIDLRHCRNLKKVSLRTEYRWRGTLLLPYVEELRLVNMSCELQIMPCLKKLIINGGMDMFNQWLYWNVTHHTLEHLEISCICDASHLNELLCRSGWHINNPNNTLYRASSTEGRALYPYEKIRMASLGRFYNLKTLVLNKVILDEPIILPPNVVHLELTTASSLGAFNGLPWKFVEYSGGMHFDSNKILQRIKLVNTCEELSSFDWTQLADIKIIELHGFIINLSNVSNILNRPRVDGTGSNTRVELRNNAFRVDGTGSNKVDGTGSNTRSNHTKPIIDILRLQKCNIMGNIPDKTPIWVKKLVLNSFMLNHVLEIKGVEELNMHNQMIVEQGDSQLYQWKFGDHHLKKIVSSVSAQDMWNVLASYGFIFGYNDMRLRVPYGILEWKGLHPTCSRRQWAIQCIKQNKKIDKLTDLALAICGNGDFTEQSGDLEELPNELLCIVLGLVVADEILWVCRRFRSCLFTTSSIMVRTGIDDYRALYHDLFQWTFIIKEFRPYNGNCLEYIQNTKPNG